MLEKRRGPLGFSVGKARVEHLMREKGIRARHNAAIETFRLRSGLFVSRDQQHDPAN